MKPHQAGHSLPEVESDPDLWNFRISFEKILPYKDKLIAIGTDNYNSDSWSGSHNFLMVVYDLNLNQLNVVKKGHSAARAYVTEAEIIDDYVIGIADAFPFENKFSYQFKVDLSELISTASSQDFVDPANEWIMADGFYNFNIGQWVSKTYKYKFTDSIVIDGKTYLELKHAEAPDFTDFEAPLFFHGDYYRQEDQIVYVSNGVEEKPVYDFGFMVGDSSDITRRETIVSSLDTITLLDGSIRETKILSRDNIPRYTIIDDIGATLWTFNTQRLGSFDVETTLLCFSHEEELLYKNALDCQQYTTTSTKAVKPEAYSLSKIGQTIKVYSQNFSDLSIKLFDISGRLIDQGELTNGLFAINSDLPTGLIVCQVFQKSKMVHTSMIFND